MATFESSNFFKQTGCGFGKSKIENDENGLDQGSTRGWVESSGDGTRWLVPKMHFRNDDLRAKKSVG